jgi:hypothetical protein
MPRISFSSSPAGCDRLHWLTEDDIRVVLSRLPPDAYGRLRAVHFNDRSRGARILGYVNRGRREIAICALPPRMSLTRFCLYRGNSPAHFGAVRGMQWPPLAIRRYILYNTFLHELGHLQLVNPRTNDERRRFAMETLAQEFADGWRRTLWAEHFEHPDPVHNPPSSDEHAQLLEPIA